MVLPVYAIILFILTQILLQNQSQNLKCIIRRESGWVKLVPEDYWFLMGQIFPQ